jgi:hypothetical protein
MMEMDLRRTHFERLRSDVPETVATSEIHLELIELLKRISSNATNIARLHLELRSEQEEEATLKVKLAKIEKKKKKKGTEENEGDETIDEEDVNNRN